MDKFPQYRIYTESRDGKKMRNVEIFDTDGGYLYFLSQRNFERAGFQVVYTRAIFVLD